ncbi:tryptophan ABC transporter substrate-binding protein [Alkalibacterium putridalgicola]|uniref:ABC transporter substrate-binding protein n=1 Tax=Alkalibacterium putridalgicola TaxID=426703 RepID=A0A1H7X6Z6_9LACT|nr:tryptophan ABC transporter substrate-binding protein [Alkalibacterium putridalgicola]GEK90081.1 ABC transporter substrate-binding protein [Alkalibacterium putridalgicola]SEM29451.1 putative ABC transport system substrate-binding protein [Alkalibacterium putridalgicola]
MKNKKLLVMLGALVVLLVGVFAFSLADSSEGETQEEVPATSEGTDTSEVSEETDEDETFVVGILQTTSHPALDAITKGAIDGLAENGYVDGENTEVLFQNGQGDQNLMNTMAQSLVEDGADILIGIGTPASQAFANATDEIPIIMGAVSDPVGAGLVDSEETPGKNITGVKDEAPVQAQLDMMLELLPEASDIGVLYSSGEDNARAEAERAITAIEDMGLNPVEYTVSSTNEIQQTVATMSQEVDAIYLPTDNTIASAFDTVVSEANRYDVPLIPTVDSMIAQGGLATVGINQTDTGFESGRMAAEVLDGTDPSDFPVYVLNEGDKLVNLEQAELLGIDIPQSVLDEATVIESDE